MDHRSQCKMQNYKTPRTGENLGHFGFLDTMSKACSIKEKVNVMDYITLKKNCSRKTLLGEWKDWPQLGEYICKTHIW